MKSTTISTDSLQRQFWYLPFLKLYPQRQLKFILNLFFSSNGTSENSQCLLFYGVVNSFCNRSLIAAIYFGWSLSSDKVSWCRTRSLGLFVSTWDLIHTYLPQNLLEFKNLKNTNDQKYHLRPITSCKAKSCYRGNVECLPIVILLLV